MTDTREHAVATHFQRSLAVMEQAAGDPALRTTILAIADCITASFRNGGKLLIAGNGGSAADAQHIAGEFLSRLRFDRNPLPAIALTTDTSVLTAVGNDYGYEVIFAKQVEALGAPGDILLAMSTSGNSANVLAAIAAAHAKEMTVIALTGNTGGKMRDKLTETDVHICVPHERTPRIQEIHLLVLHCLCDAVDLQLLGEQENT